MLRPFNNTGTVGAQINSLSQVIQHNPVLILHLFHRTSGIFILNNYKQAILIMHDTLPALALHYHETGHNVADLDHFILEEQSYMTAPQDEPLNFQEQLDYVHSLRLLDNAM